MCKFGKYMMKKGNFNMGDKLTYKAAGVDTKEGERAVELMKDHVKRTFSEMF